MVQRLPSNTQLKWGENGDTQHITAQMLDAQHITQSGVNCQALARSAQTFDWVMRLDAGRWRPVHTSLLLHSSKLIEKLGIVIGFEQEHLAPGMSFRHANHNL